MIENDLRTIIDRLGQLIMKVEALIDFEARMHKQLSIDPAEVIHMHLHESGSLYWTCPQCRITRYIHSIDLLRIAAETLPGQRLFEHNPGLDAQIKCEDCGSWFYWSLIKGE